MCWKTWATWSARQRSLSARRAWIEIPAPSAGRGSARVALRKESVDRNSSDVQNLQVTLTSLSARRAWIEILSMGLDGRFKLVALRKESVDRNIIKTSQRRASTRSLSARRAWIEICYRTLALGGLGGRSPQGERG